jgi:hypothetical protein
VKKRSSAGVRAFRLLTFHVPTRRQSGAGDRGDISWRSANAASRRRRRASRRSDDADNDPQRQLLR